MLCDGRLRVESAERGQRKAFGDVGIGQGEIDGVVGDDGEPQLIHFNWPDHARQVLHTQALFEQAPFG